MRSFLRLHPLLWRYLRKVIPAVEQELAQWRAMATTIPDEELRTQALASIRHKTFHCQGGAVFAAGNMNRPLLQFIVALQTISDYLDNLCDRAGVWDAAAFRQLHLAMCDAITPTGASEALDLGFAQPNHDYYSLYPHSDDNGYLRALVARCRQSVDSFPHYDQVYADVLCLVQLYIDLQVKKHVAPQLRVPLLQEWFTQKWDGEEGLFWQEFAAACGSTLAIFALCTEASRPESVPRSAQLLDFYFPWVCGLHILLDYLIDLEEDRQGGDLNFVAFYGSLSEAEARLSFFICQAQARLDKLPQRALAEAVLYGLPAMYLSDGKVARQGQKATARRLVAVAGPTAARLRDLCVLWRLFH